MGLKSTGDGDGDGAVAWEGLTLRPSKGRLLRVGRRPRNDGNKRLARE